MTAKEVLLHITTKEDLLRALNHRASPSTLMATAKMGEIRAKHPRINPHGQILKDGFLHQILA